MLRHLTSLVAALLLVGPSCGHAEDFSEDRPEPSPEVGAACSDDDECNQYCIRDNDFPGGFCTIRSCRSNVDCPEGTVCVQNEGGVCLFPCGSPRDCTATFLGRAGYTCRQAAGFSTEQSRSVIYMVCLGI